MLGRPVLKIYFTKSINFWSIRTLQEIPAIYALIWVPPRVIFESATGQGISSALKGKSIGQLFPKMVDQEGLNVIFNFNVVSIKGLLDDDKVGIESFDGDKMEFDYLLWSGPPSDFQKVAHVR